MACERPFSHFLREENRAIEEKKHKKTVNAHCFQVQPRYRH